MKAMTVYPVSTENPDGTESITDFSAVEHVNPMDLVNEEEDFVQDSNGEYHHRYADVDPSQYEESSDADQQYQQALLETYPSLGTATAWAGENLDPESIEWYDQAIDSGNPEQMNEAIEWLLSAYAEADNQGIASEDEEYSSEDSGLSDKTMQEIEQLDEEDQDILVTAVEGLIQSDPGGEDAARSWQYMSETASEQGDQVMATIAAATAAFHAGEVSANDSIAYVLNNCDLQDVARTYEFILNNA